MANLRPNDPYHARDPWLTPDKALDRFRECLQATGDPYAAAEKLATEDPHAAKVLDGAYTFEEAVTLAENYGGPRGDGDDGELNEVKTFTN